MAVIVNVVPGIHAAVDRSAVVPAAGIHEWADGTVAIARTRWPAGLLARLLPALLTGLRAILRTALLAALLAILLTAAIARRISRAGIGIAIERPQPIAQGLHLIERVLRIARLRSVTERLLRVARLLIQLIEVGSDLSLTAIAIRIHSAAQHVRTALHAAIEIRLIGLTQGIAKLGSRCVVPGREIAHGVAHLAFQACEIICELLAIVGERLHRTVGGLSSRVTARGLLR